MVTGESGSVSTSTVWASGSAGFGKAGDGRLLALPVVELGVVIDDPLPVPLIEFRNRNLLTAHGASGFRELDGERPAAVPHSLRAHVRNLGGLVTFAGFAVGGVVVNLFADGGLGGILLLSGLAGVREGGVEGGIPILSRLLVRVHVERRPECRADQPEQSRAESDRLEKISESHVGNLLSFGSLWSLQKSRGVTLVTLLRAFFYSFILLNFSSRS